MYIRELDFEVFDEKHDFCTSGLMKIAISEFNSLKAGISQGHICLHHYHNNSTTP